MAPVRPIFGEISEIAGRFIATGANTRVLDYINTRRFAPRNRAMMLLTHLAGLRIGEVACLGWSDVTNQDGTVKEEIRLLPDMTKG